MGLKVSVFVYFTKRVILLTYVDHISNSESFEKDFNYYPTLRKCLTLLFSGLSTGYFRDALPFQKYFCGLERNASRFKILELLCVVTRHFAHFLTIVTMIKLKEARQTQKNNKEDK